MKDYNWLQVPDGAIDTKGLGKFLPGNEKYEKLFNEFIAQGYQVIDFAIADGYFTFVFGI